jgi:murein DD-endopeptidase MepM/ murein hydrolase activator NlpD
MPNPAKTFNVRLIGQAAAIALLAGASAGCSADISRFANPFESTENRASIVRSDGVVTGSLPAAPTTAVSSNTLPPPVSSAPVASAPVSQPVSVASASPAGDVYVVQPGDSLGRIANDRGLRSIEVASYNGIDPSAPIKVGQRLRIPSGATAPVQVAAVQTNTVTDAGAPPATLGQIPANPAPSAAAPAVAAAPIQAPVETPATPTQVAAVQPEVQTNPQMSTGTGVESSTTGNFRWPVRGRVISGFGVKASGDRNDGINIEVPEGTPIKAAEGGTVIYAGSELKGYGNLVLVKHPNGFVSAYAHASEVLVKRDDVVMRGQTIGKVGTTGNVERPQLHFEIREGNKPIDPLPFLSG